MFYIDTQLQSEKVPMVEKHQLLLFITLKTNYNIIKNLIKIIFIHLK